MFVVMPPIEMVSNSQNENGRWRRGFAKVHNTLMRATAEYWHQQLFPSHFTPGNEERYGMERRSPAYIFGRKRREGVGQGKWVANLFSGQSRRWMKSLAKITATATQAGENSLGSFNASAQAKVSMQAPTYFTSPAVGTFTDKNGRRFTISRQPDKVKEVLAVDARDMTALQQFMQRKYDELTGRLSQEIAKAA